MEDIFTYSSYKDYLNARLDLIDKGGRGARARMSRAIGCQTAYTTLVLRGSANFSCEQAECINDFLGHTYEQGGFFLLLVQIERAGSLALRKRLEREKERILRERNLLKNRLDIKESLPEVDQILYYSAWYYSAIHALVSVPGFETPERIADRLQISSKTASEVLDFLLRAKIIERSRDGCFRIGVGRIHLGSDSPHITKHHMNWRTQVLKSLDRQESTNFHYSSVVSISLKDVGIVREQLFATIKEIKRTVQYSKEEEVYALSADFFSL